MNITSLLQHMLDYPSVPRILRRLPFLISDGREDSWNTAFRTTIVQNKMSQRQAIFAHFQQALESS